MQLVTQFTMEIIKTIRFIYGCDYRSQWGGKRDEK